MKLCFDILLVTISQGTYLVSNNNDLFFISLYICLQLQYIFFFYFKVGDKVEKMLFKYFNPNKQYFIFITLMTDAIDFPVSSRLHYYG